VSWIKICGIRTPAAIDAALAARVDALGFVFAPSSRRMQPQAAARLAAAARGQARLVAVTHHPSQQLIGEILVEFKPDVLQTDLEDLSGLQLPAQLERLPVLRAGTALPTTLPPRLLFEGAASGTGEPWDWMSARAVVRRTQLVLAGGLAPDTVAAAIASVQPFGVDVSSGVEERPGIKSAERIAAFVEAARGAFRRLASGKTHFEERTP
jgi:phosphoribosylanthranilate isomerase